MSRPTREKSYIDSAYHTYGPSGVIDFAPPHLSCVYEPSIYAQAGFPGYPQAGPQPLGYAYPTYSAPYPPTVSAAPPEPVDTGELHERINAKIDSIISSQRASANDHKADLLGTQIERLTRKVQKLSDSMEQRRADSGRALGAKAKGGDEDSDEEERAQSSKVSSRMRDNDIASRLRRLASRSAPDW